MGKRGHLKDIGIDRMIIELHLKGILWGMCLD
jgi:hypothetical protein